MLPSWSGAALCMLWQWEGLGMAAGKWWVLLPVALTAVDAAVGLCRVCSLGTVMHLLRSKEVHLHRLRNPWPDPLPGCTRACLPSVLAALL